MKLEIEEKQSVISKQMSDLNDLQHKMKLLEHQIALSDSGLKVTFPSEWNLENQFTNCMLIDVDKNSEEWDRCEKRVHETEKTTIKKIQRY